MFCVVVTPIGLSYRAFPVISFLGPILEEGPFRDAVDIQPASIPTPHRRDFTSVSGAEAQGFNAELVRMAWSSASKESFDGARLTGPAIEKKVPVYKSDKPRISADAPSSADFRGSGKRDSAGVSPLGFKIISGFEKADIKSAPAPPALPEWAKKSRLSFSVMLKVRVAGSGIVSEVERLTTTGEPGLDAIAMRYAQGISFVPSKSGRSRTGDIEVFLGQQKN